MRKKKLNRKRVNTKLPLFTGVKHSGKLILDLFEYNRDKYLEQSDISEKAIKGFQDSNNYYWLNIQGIHDVEKIKNIGKKVGLHNLTIQDIVDVNQRPKFEDYDSYYFFSLKSISFSKDEEVVSEQLSFVLGRNFLISFQEKKESHFQHIRERMRTGTGILRERGSDYLLFLLLESVLDNYVIVLEDIQNKIEDLILTDTDLDPQPSILKSIELYKRQVHKVSFTIKPLRDYIIKLEREDLRLVSERHKKYFSELKDLSLSILDSCEKSNQRLESSTNIYFSVQGYRMNQVMKTLTVVATIFIPLTFVVGIYGMNFSYMPELTYRWGYQMVWVVIGVIFFGMIIYFKRKKWY